MHRGVKVLARFIDTCTDLNAFKVLQWLVGDLGEGNCEIMKEPLPIDVVDLLHLLCDLVSFRHFAFGVNVSALC